jgi:TPR repeat protein
MQPFATAACTFAFLAVVATVAPSARADAEFDQALGAIDTCDYPRALAPLRTAAEAGDRRAQRLLGFMLLHGEALYRGVVADPIQALAWLRRSSGQGEVQAAFVLARLEGRSGATPAHGPSAAYARR